MKLGGTMNKIIMFYLLCFSIFTQTNITFYGDDSFPPYSFSENNNLKGIDIDMLKELEKRTGYTISVKLVPWQRLLELTKLGKINGSFSLFRTDERESFAYFTSFPLHYSEYGVFSLKEKDIYGSMEDFKGKNIGLNSGFFINKEFHNLAKKGEFNLIESENINNHINQLLNNRINFYVGNTLVTNMYLKKNKLINKVIESSAILKEATGAYIVLSKSSELPNKLEILEKLNTALESAHKDGTYKRIIKNYE